MRKVFGFLMIFAALSGTCLAIDVPEIDPASMTGALTLLSGGLLAFVDRRRKK